MGTPVKVHQQDGIVAAVTPQAVMNRGPEDDNVVSVASIEKHQTRVVSFVSGAQYWCLLCTVGRRSLSFIWMAILDFDYIGQTHGYLILACP